jgi:hypothetical protein
MTFTVTVKTVRTPNSTSSAAPASLPTLKPTLCGARPAGTFSCAKATTADESNATTNDNIDATNDVILFLFLFFFFFFFCFFYFRFRDTASNQSSVGRTGKRRRVKIDNSAGKVSGVECETYVVVRVKTQNLAAVNALAD